MRKTWIANGLLAQNAAGLGRFVLNIEYPEQDFYSPSSAKITEENASSVELETFRETLTRTEGSKFHTFLTKLFSTIYSTREESTTEIESAVCKTYQLLNSGEFFRNECGVDAARKWLERAIKRRRDVYLTVGIKTLTNTHISVGQRRSTGLGGDVELPITQPAPTGIMDSGVGGIRSKQTGQATNFMAPGEHVYAVQYRKIEFSWFSSRSIEKASLEHGNRWKIYLGGRGDEEDEEDVVDAEVQDYPERDDLEGDCEVFGFGDEEILYILESQ